MLIALSVMIFFSDSISATHTFDGDKVGLALVGDRLGQERFTTAGRTVEENALGRRHAKLQELLGMLDGILDQLLQLVLDFLQASDVGPCDIGHFHLEG